MKTAIRIEQLSKCYRVDDPTLRAEYRTLRESLVGWAAAPWRRLLAGGAPIEAAEFWALHDVSAEIRPGEVVGVIGRNGAGKSTLLKILSRITSPTSGRVELRGRVGSLLEVGTGFHPELTGRENIFLNGTVLGMTRREVLRKFDEIVAFAGVERFLDTPVKRYSSGMFVRLAFAVAAHLEPEILLVDEVLAVGDAEFQRKCLGKMRDIASGGRTILFVSHNMNAVQRLCHQALWLEQGQVVAQGATEKIVADYLADANALASPGDWFDARHVVHRGSGEARFVELRYRGGDLASGCQPASSESLEVDLAIEARESLSIGSLAVTFYDKYGTKLVNADTIALGHALRLQPGRNEVRVRIDQLHLNPGMYVVGLWLANGTGQAFDHVEAACELEVVERQESQLGRRPNCDGCVPCRFTVEVIPTGDKSPDPRALVTSN